MERRFLYMPEELLVIKKLGIARGTVFEKCQAVSTALVTLGIYFSALSNLGCVTSTMTIPDAP